MSDSQSHRESKKGHATLHGTLLVFASDKVRMQALRLRPDGNTTVECLMRTVTVQPTWLATSVICRSSEDYEDIVS